MPEGAASVNWLQKYWMTVYNSNPMHNKLTTAKGQYEIINNMNRQPLEFNGQVEPQIRDTVNQARDFLNSKGLGNYFDNWG